MLRTIAWLIACAASLHAAHFTVATYNLELYLDAPSGTMPAKPLPAAAKAREYIKALNADVLAVQEMGSAATFTAFRNALRAEGLDYPHAEFIQGIDTNLHVAVLSRFPITARRPHTNESFLLHGRRLRVLRGFIEVDIRVGEQYEFTLLNAHLKSKRQSGGPDEEEVREQEAFQLREKVDAILARRPEANLIVLGDLNDFRDARSTRAILGRGKNALVDTRPAERNGDPRHARQITWTHFYAKEDTYARLDYILLSRGLAREWDSASTYIFTTADWGAASDHRPLLATFQTLDQ